MYRSVYCLYRSSRVLPTVGRHLAGGFGTRLSEDTSASPSRWSRAPEKTVLWHSMHIYLLYQATATSPLTSLSRTRTTRDGHDGAITRGVRPDRLQGRSRDRDFLDGDQGTEIF